MNNLNMKEIKKKKTFLLIFSFCLLGITILLSYRWITQVRAEERSWTQTDWSGEQK